MAADIRVSPVGYTEEQDTDGTEKRQVWTTINVGYHFFIATIDATSVRSVFYVKTSDGGQTWSAATKINDEAATRIFKGLGVWFDKDTPTQTGTKILVTWDDTTETGVSANRYLRYKFLDTSGDTLSAQVTATTTSNGSGLGGGRVYPCRAKDATLYILNFGQASATKFMKSVDEGTNWTARTNPLNSNPAMPASLMPGFFADQKDMMLVTADGQASGGYAMRFYDDSANAWTNTAIEASTGSQTNRLSATLHPTTGRIFAFYTIANGSNSDVRCIEITSETAFTQRTNPYTGISAAPVVSACFAQNGTLYCIATYTVSGGDRDVRGRPSLDLGVVWGTEVLFNQDAGTQANGIVAMRGGSSGGRLYAVWNLGSVLYGNYGTSIALGGADGGVSTNSPKVAAVGVAYDIVVLKDDGTPVFAYDVLIPRGPTHYAGRERSAEAILADLITSYAKGTLLALNYREGQTEINTLVKIDALEVVQVPSSASDSGPAVEVGDILIRLRERI